MFESIAVLVIFMFLISIGLKFYTNTKLVAIREAEEKLTEVDTVKSSMILSNLPEISCSFQGISEVACLDFYKVTSWNALMEDELTNINFIDYYIPLLGRSEIFVEVIYPEADARTWVIYNASLSTSYDYLRVPVILHDTVSKKNKLGVLHIKTYYETS